MIEIKFELKRAVKTQNWRIRYQKVKVKINTENSAHYFEI